MKKKIVGDELDISNATLPPEEDLILCKGCWTMKHPHKFSKNKHIIPEDDSTTIMARPCKGCGWHQSIAGAVLGSEAWKIWREHALSKMLYDIDECEIIDAMSDSHFRDFIKFIIKHDRKTNNKTNNLVSKKSSKRTL